MQDAVVWHDVVCPTLTGGEMVTQSAQIVRQIQERLRAAQARQRAQADQHRRSLDLEVGQWVLFKISPMRGVLRLGRRSKLSPRFIGPFRVLEKDNPTAYRLELPPDLGRIHDVFHISQLHPF